ESESYILEIEKFFPGIRIQQQACPIWVPLVEYGEQDEPGTDYFVKKYIGRLLKKDPKIDTVLLACTHYPLLEEKIKEYMPVGVRVVSQGKIVAASLADYLTRHPEMQQRLSRSAGLHFFTTERSAIFNS